MSEPIEAQPAVTIVIPLHNHEKWINDALDSVLYQQYPNKRIIVVDDGSTDNSAKKVFDRLYRPRGQEQQGDPWICAGKALPSHDTWVMLCKFKDAHGPSFARNWGIKVGWEGTDLFCFLDSDDMYATGKIEKSVAKWLEAPDAIGAIYTDFDTLSPEGMCLRQYKEPFSRSRLMQECLPNCDSLVSKAALDKCGGFDEQMRTCEDYDLWVRISEHFTIVHIPDSLVTVRVGSHSASATVPKEIWEKNWQRVMQKAHARIQQSKL